MAASNGSLLFVPEYLKTKYMENAFQLAAECTSENPTHVNAELCVRLNILHVAMP